MAQDNLIDQLRDYLNRPQCCICKHGGISDVWEFTWCMIETDKWLDGERDKPDKGEDGCWKDSDYNCEGFKPGYKVEVSGVE